MRLLLSAFSCEPGRGSEPEVGYRALLAAAERHEVWALVSASGLPALKAAIGAHPARDRITLVPIPVGADEGTVGLVEFHLRYARWQRQAAAAARELDRRIDFHLVHHVTLSPRWTPVGVAVLDKPLVWGPVGGSVEAPWRLLGQLGARGLAEDLIRSGARRVLAHLPSVRRASRRAAVVLAQNETTARRVRTAASVRVLTNGAVVRIPAVPRTTVRSADVVFVGRLVGWKGPMLALEAFRRIAHPSARLRFYGDGPDAARIARRAAQLGVTDRISFEGWLPRETELLPRLAGAGVVLLPSLHDEAGLAVAEALTLGTPVVCLDHGGPAEVVRLWPAELWRAVPATGPTATARDLARAVDAFLAAPPPVPDAPIPPSRSFGDELERAYQDAVAAHARQNGLDDHS